MTQGRSWPIEANTATCAAFSRVPAATTTSPTLRSAAAGTDVRTRADVAGRSDEPVDLGHELQRHDSSGARRLPERRS